ncbi:MAG: hypothetical protein sL5_08350 [Candidatus Mesenet longicola]|uniref:Uncharacterized protein n=1 Tax=Candidatus Mesenet longicola TaxID=1892558 RepID=A0A8J3HV49_9RICK|nr:MAG: hypothetical protein sGL2_06890 [Candidatus Mesenet longicola]GHM59842.1 MAG: hypothetical protein sL5_08350 [Candidatus Mesenet longicola]
MLQKLHDLNSKGDFDQKFDQFYEEVKENSLSRLTFLSQYIKEYYKELIAIQSKYGYNFIDLERAYDKMSSDQDVKGAVYKFGQTVCLLTGKCDEHIYHANEIVSYNGFSHDYDYSFDAQQPSISIHAEYMLV